MRKNIVAGNWKMNTTLPEGLQLAKDVNEALKGIEPKCDVVIAVPFTHLASVNEVIDKSKLGLGAENAVQIMQKLKMSMANNSKNCNGRPCHLGKSTHFSKI